MIGEKGRRTFIIAFNPDFYGYIPEGAGKRMALFLILIAISAVQMLIKSILVVDLMYISAKYALLYLGVEIAVYLGLKVLRKDHPRASV